MDMEMYERGSEWHKWDLHLHTASSYDYKYKASDADDLLCQTLKQNGVKAVAITDHFTIDKDRIESLRSKAPEIVFFPGVELRTDKGSNNLHLILIFSEKLDLSTLSADFEAIMVRQKAKSSESDDTIYWEFSDIISFAKEHHALISIHAGRKTNGIDKEISNSLPVKDAIKADIAKNVDFFEIGQKRDVDTYERYVFKEIDRKPLIMCSDSHSPHEYNPKENLWIKANLTFEGLKQCLYQPLERIFIGDIPPILDRVNKNKQGNIASISCVRVENPVNVASNWFDFEVPLNPGMVAVIGNKGSGKSAFSDIIAHLCCCRTMTSASFLNSKRFRKVPKNYANDYSASLMWADGEKRSSSLAAYQGDIPLEDAQYLPQKYIEDVCNDFEDVFQKEIDKVIFSYVDKTERGEAQNLDELVRMKSKPLEIRFQNARTKLKDINRRIISLENKQTQEYRKSLSDSLNKAVETLKRHEKSKPLAVEKPESKDSNDDYQNKLIQLNQNIDGAKEKIQNINDKISSINSFVDDVKTIAAQITLLKTQFEEIQRKVDTLSTKYSLNKEDYTFTLDTPDEYFDELINKSEKDKLELQAALSNPKDGLTLLLSQYEAEKSALISSADAEEKSYQKYLKDLEEWNRKRAEIIGNKDSEGSVEFYKYALNYIDTMLIPEYEELVSERDEISKSLYEGIVELSHIYQSIYAPIQGEISELLGDLEDNVEFHAEVFMQDANIASNVLRFINQKYNGKYGRSHNSLQEIENRVKTTDFADEKEAIAFIHDLAEVITSDFETAEKRVYNRQEFYDFIFGLEYIGVNFKLKMGNHPLEELSPGERGIILLIFYLALSKESKPIIIDQPEDNLDNQSVYNKLVPCICKAKQKRQVIIVTHNPNIAVACDAEQIVYCEMDKERNQILYVSGAIENPTIRNHVVDVLEGTMPAFDLRRLKYN